MIGEVFGSVWAFAYLTFTIAMIVVVLIRKREPSSALGWSLAIVLLPAVGSILFLVFGVSRLPRRLRRKVEHRATYDRYVRTGAPVSVPDGSDWAPGRRLLDNLGVPAATAGNDLRLLEQGQAAFERIFDAIRAARHHVHVEMYIFRNDELGKRLVELLVSKLEAGVEVRLLVDYVGTLSRWSVIRPLRRAGGEGAVFLPLLAFGKRFAPNLRNHRKIVICDGQIAFFGGLNVGEEYLGRKKRDRDWCDLHVEVRGPAVADVQQVFAEDWDFATGRRLDGPAYYPPAEAAGEAPVRIVCGGPDQHVNPIREAFFHAVTRARKRLCIASPYVVPDPALRAALMSAARAGVEIQLLTQSWPVDNFVAELAGSYYFGELMEAGVRIFRYTPGMMHAKLVVADGQVAAVGSANLDNRSLALNFELMGVLTGSAEVDAVIRRFDAMRARAEEVTLEDYRARSGLRQVGESLARLLAPLL